jgi:DNA polymerase III delta prime subunit
MNLRDYEPKSVYDVVIGNPEARKLINDIADGKRQIPAFGKSAILLHGAYGTGKTTLARLLPAAIEFAASHSTDCHDTLIRCKHGFTGPALMQMIEQQISYVSPNGSGKHYIILDELDNMTEAAQQSLKSVMNYTSVVYIITTNHLRAIDPGVRNRSLLVEMEAAPPTAWLPFVRRILDDYGVEGVDDSDLVALIETCKGSCREIADCALTIAHS